MPQDEHVGGGIAQRARLAGGCFLHDAHRELEV